MERKLLFEKGQAASLKPLWRYCLVEGKISSCRIWWHWLFYFFFHLFSWSYTNQHAPKDKQGEGYFRPWAAFSNNVWQCLLYTHKLTPECRTHTRHSSTNPYWTLINVWNVNVAQAFSCYCESGCCRVATSRWGPGRWASSSRGCWVRRSRTGRWVWRRASRGGAGSQPSTWLSSQSRRGRTAQIREWVLQRPRTQQARSPATGARRDPRSCTGDILGGRWSRRLLLGPPVPRISGPSRGVRGRGRKWGRPRADAPQGWKNTSTFNFLWTPNQSIFEQSVKHLLVSATWM